MPRSKRKKTEATSATWKIISALGGIGSIIAIFLAVVPIWQTERDRIEQAESAATLQSIQEQNLEVFSAMATREYLNDPNINLYVTATVMAQQLYEARATSTQYALEHPASTPTLSGFGVNIIFAFDVSASTLESRKDFISTSQEIIEEISRRSPNNKYGIVVFGNGTELIIYTDNKDDAKKSLINIGNMPASNRTSLFEGIFLSYKTLINEKRDYRSQTIIVFTDGQDTRVQNSTIELSKYVGSEYVNLFFVVPISLFDENALRFIEIWKQANFSNVAAFRLDDVNPSAIAESLTK